MQLLSKAIYNILSNDINVTAVVTEGNIWHARIPQRTTDGSDVPPDLAVFFYTSSITPNDTKSGRSEKDFHTLTVVIVGKDDGAMYELASYIRYALDRIPADTYDGIVIDGSKFLNASFDPEGEYELEVQQWILEFQVTVIDNNIRD